MVYIAFISGVSRNWSTSNFLKNEYFLPPDTHTYVEEGGVRNIRYSENLEYFVFLKRPFWDLPFCLITGDLLIKKKKRSENDPRYQPFNIPVSYVAIKINNIINNSCIMICV